MRRRALVALLLVAALATAAPAEAHYIKQSGTLYSSDAQCVEAWSEISHGHWYSPFGYMKVETTSTQDLVPPLWPIHCMQQMDRPTGYIQAQPELWKDGSPYDTKCIDYGTVLNTYATWRIRIEHYYDTRSPCGDGYYGTYSGHYVKINGAWQGDWLFAAWHYLPALSSKSRALMSVDLIEHVPPLPAWVDPVTHVVDRSKLPPYLAADFDGPSYDQASPLPSGAVLTQGGPYEPR